MAEGDDAGLVSEVVNDIIQELRKTAGLSYLYFWLFSVFVASPNRKTAYTFSGDALCFVSRAVRAFGAALRRAGLGPEALGLLSR